MIALSCGRFAANCFARSAGRVASARNSSQALSCLALGAVGQPCPRRSLDSSARLPLTTFRLLRATTPVQRCEVISLIDTSAHGRVLFLQEFAQLLATILLTIPSTSVVGERDLRPAFD